MSKKDLRIKTDILQVWGTDNFKVFMDICKEGLLITYWSERRAFSQLFL